jgi:hypothetical protein
LKNYQLNCEIQAKLILKTGKKFSLQKILDRSIEYYSKNLDKFIIDSLPFIEISRERIQKIINSASDFEYQTSGNENLDIYRE